MIRRLVLAAGLLAACTGRADAQAPGASTPPESRFPPPESVGGFVLQSVKQLEGSAGEMLRYTGPGGLRADVYVYAVATPEPCLRSCDSIAVEDESNAFAEMIPALLGRGYYESLSVERDDTLRLRAASGPIHGRHLWLAGTQNGQAVRSHFYLYGLGDFLVKVRATHAPDPALDAQVRSFATELATRAGEHRQEAPAAQPVAEVDESLKKSS